MEKQLKKVVCCFRKKTTFSLKCAFFIFALALGAFVVYLMSMLNQQEQVEENFYENRNTHIIEIHSKMGDDVGVDMLSFHDIEEIKHILDMQRISGNTYISNGYFINFGISDGDQTYFLYALDDEMYQKLGMEFESLNDAFYTDQKEPEMVKLQIPQIECEEGGYSSNGTEEVDMTFHPLNDDLKNYLDGNQKKVYIKKEMFENILEIMYKMSYDEFVKSYENNSDFGINAVEKIMVYVDEFSDVENVAKAISERGYNVSYALSAFDDLSGSLQSTTNIGILVLVCFLFITVGNIFLSTEIYLRNNKKDMGILLHYGYDASQVMAIYASIFRQMFVKIFLIIMSVSIVSGLILFKMLQVVDILWILFCVMIILSLLYAVIYIRIKILANIDVLTLLRYSKENE